MKSTNVGHRIILAISGKQLSGKDYLTKLLLQQLPDFKRVGLGDAIKMELAKQKGITFEELEANKHIYRPELIALGNQGRELDDGLYWVNKVLENDGNLIVPDMRVSREFEAFKNNGALMIRVNCDRNIRAARGTLVKENDPTECNLDDRIDWDFIIDNSSTEDHLVKQMHQLIQMLPASIK